MFVISERFDSDIYTFLYKLGAQFCNTCMLTDNTFPAYNVPEQTFLQSVCEIRHLILFLRLNIYIMENVTTTLQTRQ